jgi:hypothetical protein
MPSFPKAALTIVLVALVATTNLSISSAFAGGSPAPVPAISTATTVQDISVEMTRATTAVDGSASDQIKSFYRSKSGRTVKIVLRQKTTKFVYELVALKPTSSDGYGDDVSVFTLHPKHTIYKIVAPKGFYVNFIYIQFAPLPTDDSASGLYSMCGSMGCG